MSLYPTILLAVNPDDKEAHKLMIKAAVIAEQNNAELHLAYVEPGIGNVSYMDVELELDEVHNALEIKRMQQLADLAKQSPYPVGKCILPMVMWRNIWLNWQRKWMQNWLLLVITKPFFISLVM